ncbi:MAG TPA: hypothetical protein VMN38_10605 [Sphingomicrobium sp.]|nr:hypothetical protein [Sphingomicrobium sp.]
MSSKLLLAPLALGLLAGCNTVNPQTGSVDPAFGEAVKYDMAIQIIDPDPVYHEDGAQPGENGARGAEAVKRYRTGQVKEVEQIQTTTTSGGGGPQ